MNYTRALPYDRQYFVSTLRWAKMENVAGGVPFDDPVVSTEGIRMVLLVPEGTPPEICTNAILAGRGLRDVASAEAIILPDEWFSEAGINPASVRKGAL